MTDDATAVAHFSADYRRIIGSWKAWDGVARRKSGRNASLGLEPPTVDADGQLAFRDSLDVSYFLVPEDGVYFIDTQERGTRARYWMFRRFADAEKYLLVLISEAARPGPMSASPIFRWYRQGLNTRVTLSKPDPENFPGRVSLTVDREPSTRGWMGETDAISFSHAIVLSYDELEHELQQGIPADWFTPEH